MKIEPMRFEDELMDLIGRHRGMDPQLIASHLRDAMECLQGKGRGAGPFHAHGEVEGPRKAPEVGR